MANITLTVTVENLENEELDMVADKYEKFLSDNISKLPGKVTDCTELDREEDDEIDAEED
jgi:hypothetical protein